MYELYLLITLTLAFDGLLVGVLTWAYRSPRFAEYRIRATGEMQIPWKYRLRTMGITAVVSLAAVLGTTYFVFDAVMHEAASAWWMVALQAAAILLVYDFIYYFAHRVMHLKRVLRLVHGVHHRSRNPSALESFYLHPVETLTGLALLFVATFLISLSGAVHIYAFAAAFLVYSTLNILVHSGLDTRIKLLYPIDFLARKHHVHHMDDPGKNFSSLTPLPDLLFGTSG